MSRSYAAAIAARRRIAYAVLAVVLALALLTAYAAEIRPITFYENIDNFGSYFYRILPQLRWETFSADFGEWMWGWHRWLRLLFETILIAYLATVFGALAAFAACFFASSNLIAGAAIPFAVRRLLDFCRTVPDLVFALIFVRAFGFGAMAGVLALAIHTLGSLGKLYAEAVENIDTNPLEGITATGGSWVERVRYAILPQVLPAFLSYGLLRFEVNVRTSTIIGFVGAGGIGQDFLEAIRKFYYADVSAILALIIVTVFAIDILTGLVRKRLIEGAAP